MFIVKASYRKETRRFSIAQTSFPSYEQLFSQLNRVLPLGKYRLSNVQFTPVNGAPQALGKDICSAEEYRALTAQFDGQAWVSAKLRFNVLDNTSRATSMSSTHVQYPKPPHTVTTDDTYTHSVDLATPKGSQVTLAKGACCSVSQGKQDVQRLFNKFLADFGTIISNNFTDHVSDHSSHREEEVTVASSGSVNDTHVGISCDYCGGGICGVRYKCSVCSDYDLCADCTTRRGAQATHVAQCGESHTFISMDNSSVRHGSADTGYRNATTSSSPAVEHRGIVCDACQSPVVGSRHKCLDCPDYDLCDNCAVSVNDIHPFHEFIKLDEPGKVVIHTVGGQPQASVHHNAACDMCDSRIKGDRYKCTNCPDFDVCDRCITIVPAQHPVHIFVKIRNPSDIMAAKTSVAPTTHSAKCNVCHQMIFGVRYKCMHASCPDFDLCMNCEALPIPVHPENHPLWKLRTNINTSSDPTFGHRKSETPWIGSGGNKSYNPTYISGLPDENRVDAAREGQTKVVDSTVLPLESVKEDTVIPEPDEKSIDDLKLSAAFVSDNNMEDGVIIAPGAEFVKSWRMHNNGDVSWPDSTEIVFVTGNRLAAFEGAPNGYLVGRVAPGEVVDVWAADMKAPDASGRYISYWSLRDPIGRQFGHRIWCDIVVPELDEESITSGSIVLPSPAPEESHMSALGLGVTGDSTPSSLTEPVTAAESLVSTQHSQGTLREASDGGSSSHSDNWENGGSVDEMTAGASPGKNIAQALEYVVLFDSDGDEDIA